MGVEKSDKLRLYIRLPVKIDDAFKVKELNRYISEVSLPRQKSSRWCIVQFKSKEDLEKAAEELKKVKIDGKNIQVREFKRKRTSRKKGSLDTESLKSLLIDKEQS